MQEKRVSDPLQTILDGGVVAIIRSDSSEGLVEAVRALADGGVKAVEITLNTPGALEAISTLAKDSGGEYLIGAGTVLDGESARRAIDAGAEFLVSPHVSLDVIEMGKGCGRVVCPGALSPTEVLTAWEAGGDIIKVFPAARVGGPSYIKALKGPLPHVRVMPVGGVNLENIAAYVATGACAVAMGGQLLNPRLIKQGEWEKITEAGRRCMSAIAKARSAG